MIRTDKGKNATTETITIQHWITRKLDPATQSWTVVDDYVATQKEAVQGLAICLILALYFKHGFN